ncbi:MAG: Asparagine synthetase [Eubacteriales bacterium SKADARSKE-1]|nr:Asparagine synthetase [Eubacteriales bacterium SKADARSKE-1]
MCGFVGFIGLGPTDIKKQIIKSMADTIIHRGPDDEGYYVDESIALGFRRLSIIDLGGGSQPIYNEDNTKVIVFNGEIYNYLEIKEDLIKRGHTFKSDVDTEVILHGYEEYGKEILQKLRGMYAFVIWDKSSGKIFGARDIFGIKPFYYYLNNNTFLFASEIKAFLPHPNFEKELNEERLPDYLSFEYIPDDETLFKNVYKLLGGHYFIYENGEITIKKYFDINYDIDNSKSLEDWENIITKTVRESVKAHEISDVEVGCFLSSGVDSSYITTEISKDIKTKAFSIGYKEEKYSELPYAQAFSKQLGIDFFMSKVSSDEIFNMASTIQYHMDEPLPNPSALPLYFLAKLASEKVKVVVSGEGADELFGGYNYYMEPIDYENYKKVPLAIRKVIAKVIKILPDMPGKRFLIRASQPIEKRFIRNNYVFSEKERKKVLKNTDKLIPTENVTKPYFDKAKELDDVSKMQYVDIHTWMAFDILQKADKMSMASSLELRVPFLDKEVLKVAMQIPAKHRVTKENTKLALRKAAIKQMPARTANKKKLGFPVPLNDWLREDKYYNMVKNAFESDVADKFFNKEFILSLLEEHKIGKNGGMKKIWSIYSFILWYDEFFVKR